MARSKAVSGFPEWLPEGRMVERQVLDALRRVFELHSYVEIETRAVEPLGDLLRKGETSKEVYVLGRLQDEGASFSDDTLALHFDLTVPLARYVLGNAGRLDFPFKRCQIQKVWRGERPQQGRFREFTQADVDVIGRDTLPFTYEVEVAAVMAEALRALPIGQVRLSVNNRKVCEAFYRGLGLEDVESVLRWIDKLAKIGPVLVGEGLESSGLTPAQSRACLELASLNADDDGITALVSGLASRLGVGSALLETGLSELGELMLSLAEDAPGVARADLSVARGLDYYTGSVYETTLIGAPELGSICSGGRYDNLVSSGKQVFPGVGLSIGVTRLVSHMLGSVGVSRSVPACVWIAVVDEEHRSESRTVARALRARGIPCDVSPNAAKYGKQIAAADRRGIPFVWFPGEDGEADQVKDIRSGEQVEASSESWSPPDGDLVPGLVGV